MYTQIQIDQLIKEIVSGYDPEKIYLFGSYAKNDFSENSDIDLFIVKNTSKRKIERNQEVRKCIKNYPLTGLDLVVYTPAELENAMTNSINIGKEAVNKGKLVYERI
jgi:predicted nucleotidyltransferase